MPCQQLWPLPRCGWHGVCETTISTLDNVTEISFCVCEGGFSQTVEMNFFFDDDFNSSVCIYSIAVQKFLYSGLLILAVFTLCLQLPHVDNKRKLIRQIPSFSFSFIIFCLSVFKLADPRGATLGVNAWFSFLCTSTGVAAQISAYIFLTKYFKYMDKQVRISLDRGTRGTSSPGRSRRLYFFICALNTVFIQLIWVAALVRNKRTAKVIIRVAMAFNAFRALYEAFFYQYSLSGLSRDLEKMVEENKHFSKVIKEDFKIWVQRRIPKIRNMRKQMVTLSVLEALIWGLGVFWDLWLHTWMYLYAVEGILLHTYIISVILAKRGGVIIRSSDEMSSFVSSDYELRGSLISSAINTLYSRMSFNGSVSSTLPRDVKKLKLGNFETTTDQEGEINDGV